MSHRPALHHHPGPTGTKPVTLAARFRAGQADALAEIYRTFAPAVLTVALTVLNGNRMLADDTVQETFLRAWKGADRFDASRPFGPWLLTIARRTAIDVHRKEMRPTRGDHGPEQDVAVDGLSFEQCWIRWQVRQALDDLDPLDRELIRLGYYHGMSQTQIARHLDMPLGTVKSRSIRAQRRLSVALRSLVINGTADGATEGLNQGIGGETEHDQSGQK